MFLNFNEKKYGYMKDFKKILANDTRLQILEMLNSNGKMTPSEIIRHFNISPNEFSNHFKLLIESGLIETVDDGYKLSWLGNSISPYFDILSVSLQPLIIMLVRIVDGNNVLLVKRTKNAFNGYWAMPGGKLYFGEEPDKAVERIVKKETGLDVKSIEPIASFWEKVNEEQDTKYHSLKLVFNVEVKNNKIMTSGDRIAKWIKLNETQKMKIIPSDMELIKSSNGKIFRFGDITMKIKNEKLKLDKVEMKNFFA